MPSNYEKLSRPSGTAVDTTVSIPKKCAFSNSVSTCPVPEDTPRTSTASTPRSDKSVNPFDTDIEAMVPTYTTDSCMNKTASAPPPRKSDCQVWPGKDHWKQKAKAAKARRSCNCMAGLSPRNRIIVKVLLVFLVVGIAVGVGFGVSKPLGAPIWGDDKER